MPFEHAFVLVVGLEAESGGASGTRLEASIQAPVPRLSPSTASAATDGARLRAALAMLARPPQKKDTSSTKTSKSTGVSVPASAGCENLENSSWIFSSMLASNMSVAGGGVAEKPSRVAA